MKRKKRKKQQPGVVLVLAVTMVVILTLLGVGLIRLGLNARMQGIKDVKQISARAAADAGIEHAVRFMIDGWNGTSDKPGWLASWNDATPWPDPATPETALGHSFGPVDLSGTYGDASFIYDIYKGTKANGYQIISTGTAGDTTRVVHAAVVLRSVFFGIGAKEDIFLYPNTELGTVPDGDTMVIQTNGTHPNVITLKPNIIVPGDVVSGPGSDPDVAIDLASNSKIEGDARASEDYIDFPPVYVPAELLSLPFETPEPNATNPKIAHISGDIRLKGLQFKSGVLKGVDTIYIKGDPSINEGRVNVFVDGVTDLDASIIVTEGTSLTLYLGGNLVSGPGAEIIYGGELVTDTGIIEAAKSISIKGTIAADGTPLCTEIHFQPKGDFYGTIYAPDAAIEMWPVGDFYGAIVGGNSVELKPGGTYMYIPSLVETEDVEVLYMGIKQGSWWED